MERLRIEWGGSPVVGPGVSTFYGDEGQGGLQTDLFHDFFEAISGVLPAGTTVTVPTGGDLLDPVTGVIGGFWTNGDGGVTTGVGNAVHAAGVGARCVWHTNGITNGRRVRGSTFIVPISATWYQDDGTIATEALTILRDAAADLMTDHNGGPVVWTRAVGGAGGAMHDIVSSTVPDRVSWLVSRRT